MHFTVHAVEQYIARCRPGTSYPAALATLKEHVPSARPLRERSGHGDAMFLLPELGCRLVVKRERGQMVVTTVLAAGGPVPDNDPPAPPLNPEQSKRDALHALRNYLEYRSKNGDARAARLYSQLQNAGVLF